MPGFVHNPGDWPTRMRWGVAIGLFVLLLLAGILPNPLSSGQAGGEDGLPVDKLAHFVFYAIWGWVILSHPKSSVLWILPLIALALIQESSQVLVEHREFEWADWLADSLGILSAHGAVWFRRRNQTERLA